MTRLLTTVLVALGLATTPAAHGHGSSGLGGYRGGLGGGVGSGCSYSAGVRAFTYARPYAATASYCASYQPVALASIPSYSYSYAAPVYAQQTTLAVAPTYAIQPTYAVQQTYAVVQPTYAVQQTYAAPTYAATYSAPSYSYAAAAPVYAQQTTVATAAADYIPVNELPIYAPPEVPTTLPTTPAYCDRPVATPYRRFSLDRRLSLGDRPIATPYSNFSLNRNLSLGGGLNLDRRLSLDGNFGGGLGGSRGRIQTRDNLVVRERNGGLLSRLFGNRTTIRDNSRIQIRGR